jgi:hypothetical protein
MASRILYRQDGAGTSHENTTDEAVIGSYQIPARFLAKGKTLRWQGSVWVEDNNSTDTLTIDLKVGTVALTGTDVHTSGAIDVADNDVMFWDLIVEPRSAAGSASGDVLVHGTATILGAIGTGILVNTALGGAGIPDYESKPGELAVGAYAFGTVVWTQTKAVLFTIAWTGIGSFILYKIVDVVIGLRVTAEQEREGLDIAEHGERAYNY